MIRNLKLAVWTIAVSVVQIANSESIPIENNSFESPVTSSELWNSQGTIPGWGFYNRYQLPGYTYAVVNGTHSNRLPSGAPDGTQVGAAREGFFRNVLYGHTIQANTRYTLKAHLGIDDWFPSFGLWPRGCEFALWGLTWQPGYDEIKLVAKEFPEGTWTYGTMDEVTMQVDIPSDSPYIGWTLMPALDQENTNSITQIDKVELNAVNIDWLNNQLGVTDDTWVPAPWTPMEYSVSPVQARCWGREYTFNSEGLSSVKSLDSELLSSPMTWDVRVYKNFFQPNYQVNWTTDFVTIISWAPGAVEFISGQTGDTKGLKLFCSGRIEFDGFIKLEYRIETTESSVTLKKVALDIPFNTAYASLINHFPLGSFGLGAGVASGFNSGSMPAEGWDSEFLPYVWIGNEDKGMQWLCETNEGWNPADPDTAIQVIPNGGTTTLRLNIIGDATTLTTPLEYTFGFEASPVKPMPADRYTWHYTSRGGCSEIINEAEEMKNLGINAVSTFSWTELMGYPIFSGDIPNLDSAADACHQRDMDILVFQAFLLSSKAPEYAGFYDECVVLKSDGTPQYQCTGYLYEPVYAVCQNSSWADFVIKGIDTTVRQFDLDGLYTDSITCVGNCYNTKHGCAYIGEDEQIHPRTPIFGTREVVKRIYRVLELYGDEQNKTMKWVGHMSANMMLPLTGFCDRYLDTEHLTNRERPFTIPLDSFRAAFMGRNFGIPAQTVSYYSREIGGGAGLTEQEMLAISMIHNTEQPWAYEAMSPIWLAWDDFGMTNVQFLPYWNATSWGGDPPVGVEMSAYVKPGSAEMLIMASNLTDQSIQGVLDLQQWHINSATDAFSGNSVTTQNGMISDTFPSWELKMYKAQLSDWTAPVAGTISIAPVSTTVPFPVNYSGASDGGSGLKKVELWYKNPGSSTWVNSGLVQTGESGIFQFTPTSGPGTYYFALVAEDNWANRSAQPTGDGSASTTYQ